MKHNNRHTFRLITVLPYLIVAVAYYLRTEKKGKTTIASPKRKTVIAPTLLFPFHSVIEKPNV